MRQNARTRNEVENITWTFVEFFSTLARLRTGGSPEESGGFPDRPRRPWIRKPGNAALRDRSPYPAVRTENGRFVGRWTWQPTPDKDPVPGTPLLFTSEDGSPEPL